MGTFLINNALQGQGQVNLNLVFDHLATSAVSRQEFYQQLSESLHCIRVPLMIQFFQLILFHELLMELLEMKPHFFVF
jgi:hypothetical protein